MRSKDLNNQNRPSNPSARYGLAANILLALSTVALAACTTLFASSHVHVAIWSGVVTWIALAGWIYCSALQQDTRNRRLARRAVGVVSAVAIIFGAGAEFLVYQKGAKIALSIGFTLQGADRETSGALWFARQDYIAPVNAAVLVRLTNLTDAPVAVDRFECWMKDNLGHWRELAFMQAAGKLYCCTHDRTGLASMHAVQLDGEGLFRVLQNGPVPARSQLTNWLIFEYPPYFAPSTREFALRLIMWDSDDRKYTAENSYSSVADVRGNMSHEKTHKLHPVVQEELDRLIMKAVYQPVLDLSFVRTGHVVDEFGSP